MHVRIPSEAESETIAIAMEALEKFARSIDMPKTMFMSAIQALAIKNLSKMDEESRKLTLEQMTKVASDAYKSRIQNDPLFEPIHRAKDRCDAKTGPY
jgi:hypothetical protein